MLSTEQLRVLLVVKFIHIKLKKVGILFYIADCILLSHKEQNFFIIRNWLLLRKNDIKILQFRRDRL